MRQRQEDADMTNTPADVTTWCASILTTLHRRGQHNMPQFTTDALARQLAKDVARRKLSLELAMSLAQP